jgi:hypothetical protein
MFLKFLNKVLSITINLNNEIYNICEIYTPRLQKPLRFILYKIINISSFYSFAPTLISDLTLILLN